MTVNTHVLELKKKHASLNQQIEEAQRAPGVDDLTITEMKKKKLRIKEEIERLSA